MQRVSGDAAARPQLMVVPEMAPPLVVLQINTFPELVALAGEKRDVMTKTALEADVRLVRIEDGLLEVSMERTASRTLINELSRKLEKWTNRRWTVIVSNEEGAPTLRSQKDAIKSQRERAAEADPRVQEVLARFPGTKILEVRRLVPELPDTDATGEDPAEMPDNDD